MQVANWSVYNYWPVPWCHIDTVTKELTESLPFHWINFNQKIKFKNNLVDVSATHAGSGLHLTSYCISDNDLEIISLKQL